MTLITACGGGGGGGGIAGIVSTVLSGSVGDGPIVGATVIIKAADGTVLATTTSNDNANFNVSVKAKGKDYPLIIETTGGIDLVTGTAPDFDMTSVASAPSQKRVNVNPFSTMIEKVARTMPGGLRVTNIEDARAIVLSELNFGLDTSLMPDPITSVVTGDNVATIVKASETMAEMIRRTRDTYGSNITGGDVISAMAADLADGKINGSGLAGTNAHISAVSNIVTSQVLLEAMNNNLRVNGDIATNAMDYAIGVSLPGAPSSAITQNVVINEAMITQTIDSIQAAQSIAPSVELTNLLTAVESVSADSLPEDISDFQSSDLDSAIVIIETASTPEIEIVNAVNAPENNAPELTGMPTSSVAEGSSYSFTPSASDADNNALTFSVANKPTWASFNTISGALTGTPGYSSEGTYNNIVITVSDGMASASLNAFSITVSNQNRVPTITGTPAGSMLESSSYSFTPGAIDADSDALVFSISNKPAWASFNASSGALTGTPGYSSAGSYNNIVITVSDGIASASLTAFSITVFNQNRAPTIIGTPAGSVSEGSSYSFSPSAGDADSNSLTFGITNKPVWASFNTSTGALAGTPDYQDSGTYTNVVITVSDGMASASLTAFSITVSNQNRAPTITGTPSGSVSEGFGYSFTPSASDADNETLTFSITNKPVWAYFNPSTGALTGTPGYSDSGTYTDIVITVSDSIEGDDLNAFSITVENLNQAPSITGTPASSVIADSGYSFTPSVSDADGDALTFSITNMPAWASFNTSTGALTGTPGAGDVGTASNIVISVSDGTTSIYLSSFSIGVVSYGVSSATLSWTPPTTKTDGSVLDDLAGYKIRYGTASGSYTDTIDVSNAGLSSYVVENLTSNTYYFVVTAYNASGTESVYSGEVSKTIQ